MDHNEKLRVNMAQKISTIIFDMDGLLFDTERVTLNAWNRALADYGYTPDDYVYLDTLGLTRRDSQAIFTKFYGPDLPFQQLHTREKQYVEEYLAEHGMPTKPGLVELLNFLEKLSLKKAVASSAERDSIIKRLNSSNLMARFDKVVGGDEVQKGKPAPDIFLAAANRLNVPAKQCIVLEDSEVGVQAAHRAGMAPIMIPDLKPPTEKSILAAYKILPSLHELKSFLEQLFEAPA